MAQCNLGTMYALGEGVSRDYAMALHWYGKAAGQGDAKAQYNLGIMYSNGDGVARNKAEALRWLRRAAERGDEQAQKELNPPGAAL